MIHITILNKNIKFYFLHEYGYLTVIKIKQKLQHFLLFDRMS